MGVLPTPTLTLKGVIMYFQKVLNHFIQLFLNFYINLVKTSWTDSTTSMTLYKCIHYHAQKPTLHSQISSHFLCLTYPPYIENFLHAPENDFSVFIVTVTVGVRRPLTVEPGFCLLRFSPTNQPTLRPTMVLFVEPTNTDGHIGSSYGQTVTFLYQMVAVENEHV